MMTALSLKWGDAAGLDLAVAVPRVGVVDVFVGCLWQAVLLFAGLVP